MLDHFQYYYQVLCNGMKMRFRMFMIAHPGPGIRFHKRLMWRIIIPPTPVTGGPAYMLSPSLPLGSPIWTTGEPVVTTSQMNIVALETKSDLAATSLELSCDPDGGELSLKELRPVKCKDSTVSNDKESIESSDSDLDKDVLDV